MALLKEATQFRGQSFHLVLKRLSVVFLLSYAHITARCEDEVLRPDVLDRAHGTEALLVFKRTITELFECISDTGNIFLLQLSHSTGHHRSHLSSINEECLPKLLLVACEEPQRNGYARGIEQLRRQGDDSLYQVSLNNALPDFTLTTCLR